jgi:NitT/TauT family transport system permease protein
METMGVKVRRYPYRPRILYETTLAHHLASLLVVVLCTFLISILLLHFANPKNTFDITRISLSDVFAATMNTFFRMLVAYIAALGVSIPLGLLIAVTPNVQRILLPAADILQSVPVLAFFPVVVVFFTTYHAFEAAAIFVIFVTMLWNIVFPIIQGLHTIPDDIRSAAVVFHLHGFKKLWYLTLPAIFPFIVVGSLMAWAQGWTVVIIAEVLHIYIPHGSASQDLLGLGSLLVDSNAQGQTSVFAAALIAMIVLVAVINLVVWQPLLRLSQRFRFD